MNFFFNLKLKFDLRIIDKLFFSFFLFELLVIVSIISFKQSMFEPIYVFRQ